jgi:hypothetical protein
VYSGRSLPMFRREVLLPSSESRDKASKQSYSFDPEDGEGTFSPNRLYIYIYIYNQTNDVSSQDMATFVSHRRENLKCKKMGR